MEVINMVGYWLNVLIKVLIDRQIQRGYVNDGINSHSTTDKWNRLSADCYLSLHSFP